MEAPPNSLDGPGMVRAPSSCANTMGPCVLYARVMGMSRGWPPPNIPAMHPDCLKAYHPHCVGNDQSILETQTEWNCRWHSCFFCQKSSSYRCLCCPISVCGRCIRRDARFVPIKKKITGLCNNCLKLAIMIEEKADVDSDGGKVDFQDRTTSEYLFKDYWEIVNEKEGLTLEDLYADDSRLKKHQVFKSGSESDADEVLEEEMLAEADLCSRDLCSGMKTPTKRCKSKKKTLLAWSSDVSLEEGENSKKARRILSDSGPKSEQNHCKKNVTEQPKSEYAAIVEKNINSLYLRKSLALKLLGDPETFEHKVRGCFVRVKVDPKNFYSFPFKLYPLGQVKGVKKVDHAYHVGEVNTDVVLCITNMNDVRISMLSDEDIEEEDCEDLRQMVKKDTFKRPSITELDKKIRSMHRDIMSHWIERELSRLAKKIERANDNGWRSELHNLIDERELLRTPKEQNRLLDEIPSIIADMEDLPTAALEITSMEIDDTKQNKPPEVIDRNGLNVQSESEKKLESPGADKPLYAEGISSISSIKSEFKENQLDAHGTNILSIKSESAKQHEPLDTEMTNNSRSSIKRKSDALKAFSPDVEGLPMQTGESLSADAINSNRSSIEGEFKEKLLDVQGTNKPLAMYMEGDTTA